MLPAVTTAGLDQQHRFREFNSSGQVQQETNKSPPLTSSLISSKSYVEEATDFLQPPTEKLTNQELGLLENLDFLVTSDNSNAIVFDDFLNSTFQKSVTEELSDQRLVLTKNVDIINLHQFQSDKEFNNGSEN